LVAAPGRVNLIGEHIDYHGLAVLPMALERTVRVAYRARADALIRAAGAPGYGYREFPWARALQPVAAGDWENYLRAAAQLVGARWSRYWDTPRGVDAAVTGDVPPAAGLASSSALLVAFSLALLGANGIEAGFEELMEVLPDGEQFVGTRGGGMDHAAVLGSRAGCASLIEFEPLSVRHIRVPREWSFLVAHSLVTAEKSGAARVAYNARRQAGAQAPRRLGAASYREVLEGRTPAELMALARERLQSEEEIDSFLHTTSEAWRVAEATAAMERGDAAVFGRLLAESHASLRDRLKVSCRALDKLVDSAMQSGALGARLTGAGFGGCAVIFCPRGVRPEVRAGLLRRFYAGQAGFAEERHLIDAEPGPGVLYQEEPATPHA